MKIFKALEKEQREDISLTASAVRLCYLFLFGMILLSIALIIIRFKSYLGINTDYKER